MKYILGVDAGTTAFKAALFDTDGNLVSKATVEYVLQSSADRVELPAERYWEVFCEAVKGVLSGAKGVKAGEIAALSIDSQGETMVVLDRDGQPLRNAIVWLDNRAVKQADALREKFTIRRVYEITGQSEVAAGWPASKLLWLRENEPEIFSKIHKVLLLPDYLVWRLTGVYATEKSIQSSSMLLDVTQGRWWVEVLEAVGIGADQLPELLEPGDPISGVTARASEDCGLARGTVVVAGTLDQLAGMLGAGAVEPGVVSEMTGTALAMCSEVKDIPPFREGALAPCHYHALKGRYCSILWTPAAGLALKWLKNNFYIDAPSGNGLPDIFTRMDQEAALIPPGCDGLLMLPHLCGANLPVYNPVARGVFFGATINHTRSHFVRSVLEAVAFMAKRNLEALEKGGVQVKELRLMGGGAKSPLWNSIKADVYNRRVLTLKNDEPACLGAAAMAGAGVGIFSSVEEACASFVRPDEDRLPDPENAAAYGRAYRNYCLLDDRLDGLFKEMYI